MSDVRLFRLSPDGASELQPQAAQIERSLQKLFEANLDILLGVRFLASEYSTGAVHGGRIDTLGIDEDGSPVIIEYKRSINENVINQWLFYLDWLMDHQKEFQWLAMDALGDGVARGVDWSAPRLICIAGDFTRYDGHAVKQINRNIELLRYRRFDDDMLIIDLVHTPRRTVRLPAPDIPAAPTDGESIPAPARADASQRQSIGYRLANAATEQRDIWNAAVDYLQRLGDDVQTVELKYYVAFKRLKNFVCLEIYPSARTIVAYVKLNPQSVVLEPGFTRDVRAIGHYGTGDLEIVMRSLDDVARAQLLFQRAYDGA